MALLEVYSNWTWQNLNAIQGYQTPQTVIGVLPGIEFLATDKLALAAGRSLDLAGGKMGSRNIPPCLTSDSSTFLTWESRKPAAQERYHDLEALPFVLVAILVAGVLVSDYIGVQIQSTAPRGG